MTQYDAAEETEAPTVEATIVLQPQGSRILTDHAAQWRVAMPTLLAMVQRLEGPFNVFVDDSYWWHVSKVEALGIVKAYWLREALS